MPTVQELLTALRQHTEEAPTAAQIQEIVDAVKELDTLLVAFFPPTGQFFITKEQNQPTAVIFSNRDSFERFAERCKEQGLYTAAVENAKSERQALFTDFYRRGFTRVLIDYAPVFLVLPVTDFYDLPDFSALPLTERPFPAPALTGRIHDMFQQIHSEKAEGGMELELLRELYRSAIFMPVQVFRADGKDAYTVPAEERDGKRIAHLFTDRIEWERYGVSADYSPAIARFPELQRLLQSGFDQIIINPGSGAELVLDAQLLEAAEQAVMGDVNALDLRSMQERGEKLNVTDPGEEAEPLVQALTEVLTAQETVNTAYLRVLKRESLLHPSYLVLLDTSEDRGRKALYRALSAAAQPHLGSNDIEFAEYQAARDFAGNVKPFYKKKKRGLFK